MTVKNTMLENNNIKVQCEETGKSIQRIIFQIFLFPKQADPIKETFLLNFSAIFSLWELIPNAGVRVCFGKCQLIEIIHFDQT